MNRRVLTAARAGASAILTAGLVLANAAHAHVTLEVQQAQAGDRYKAVFRIGHGCEGSPTTAVRVQVPDGMMEVRPMPKPGWEVEIVRVTLDEPQTDAHGNEVTERVSEIRWTGGRLLDEHYDEFVMRMRLPDGAEGTIHFPTVQECEEGVHRWIEIPEEGRSHGDYGEPAPQLTIVPRS